MDTEASNLFPDPGENQRFCYHITGVGEDSSEFADLSHFVLGICPEIEASQIENITVVIDGVSQEVEFGEDGNVELRNPPTPPDPPTGCPGLKFDFGLDKVDGVMDVCFELTTPLNLGPNTVCLFGGNVTENQLAICGPICEPLPPRECIATVFQPARICVPVTVTPFVRELPTTTFCCGDPVVTPGATTCPGEVNGSCTFTITQDICVRVPIEFGANTTVGDTFVTCGAVSDLNICEGCSTIGQPTTATPNSNNAKTTKVKF
ncbi:MAG: hypothetical protein ACOX5F_11515 [Anaerovoracaceae bacterium]